MHEILRNLPAGSLVLDLGCYEGSFPPECCPASRVVRLDREAVAASADGNFVQADAAYLPFGDGVFEAVICNHSLEHVEQLRLVLREIGRVVRGSGSLYVAVPDSSSVSDRVYRWLYHGGGHINDFRSAERISESIAEITGLRLACARTLHASFVYLQRARFGAKPPRRLLLLGNGNPRFVAILAYLLRLLDRLLGTRASVYGWALYFGNIREEVCAGAWRNVCVQCGAGHPAAWLMLQRTVRREMWLVRSYCCPACSAWNLFTED